MGTTSGTASGMFTTGDRKVEGAARPTGPWIINPLGDGRWAVTRTDGRGFNHIRDSKEKAEFTRDVENSDYGFELVRSASHELLAALECAVGHIEHMAAFIGGKGTGYSFESLGEDMPGIRAAIAKATGTQPGSPVVTVPSNADVVVP